MSKFNLTSGAQSYTLDTDGTFTSGGTAGKWTTHDSGDLILQTLGAADVRLAVGWAFNASNQLQLKLGTTVVFNFHSGGLRPLYRLVSNVLQMRPNAAFSFEFALPFTFALDPSCNLIATYGGAASTLNGFIDDKKGRMIFFFSDRERPSNQYALTFNGEWSRSGDADKAKEIRLVFTFQQKGASASFTLPAGADVKDNHLVFSYQKDGATRSVALMGSVKVSDNFDVTFTIAQQTNVAGGVVTKETSITVGASFEMKNLSGALELTLVNSTQKLTINGTFHANIGANGTLGIDFNYAKESITGATAKVTIAVEGSFKTNDGTTFTFSYKRTPGSATVLTVTGNGQLGAVGVTGGIQVTMPGGASRSVAGFLQLAW